MGHAPLPVLPRAAFGETQRRDAWWLPNVPIVVILTSFLIYATWAAFQNAHYTFGPYLSPFYSPELFGASHHAWFGPRPAAWPGWIPFSPALLILPIPALFRFTCYYYRGSYYKAFWQDPPACTVGEPRKTYLGERYFPLIIQNFHRYGLLLSILVWFVLTYDAWLAFWFPNAAGSTSFGIGLGTIVMTVNIVLLGGYLLGCHSTRHIVGGILDRISSAPVRRWMYDSSSCANRVHGRWAWFSLFSVALTDVYIRLCSMGIIHDPRLF